ncbi:multi-sensor signal transduction histidine kinase [Gloeothece citriformis PCC 7424]|uniref:histidine kinase n=1 Tax=Gloeothece citriformis (strain PCC 7424) TaxID=65393 RepID=B7KFN2_GLOC7|nr:CHASE2 domain-containing protein [Gloeothece citriformis]ACK73357.1 multi-sensor signal transduction histidine kinase [Gloeothece citriformis PCC 7424]
MNQRFSTVGMISLILTCILWTWKGGEDYLSHVPVIPSSSRLELKLYDWIVSLRGSGKIDSRIVLVGFTSSDFQKFNSYPSDHLIADVIETLKQEKPKLIGLGFWRHTPTSEGWERLQTVIKQTPNLIGVEYESERFNINPPKSLEGKTGDTTLLLDQDKLIRRQYLYPLREQFPANFQLKPDNYNYTRNFAWELAYHYLSEQGVKIQEPTPENPRIILDFPNQKPVVIEPLKDWEGERVKTQDRLTFLINWTPQNQYFETYSFQKILENNPKNLEGKIILIGSLTLALKDLYLTPYEKNPLRFGLELDAISVSNLINIGENPFPQTFPEWVKYLWILFWVGVSAAGILLVSSTLDQPEFKLKKFFGLNLIIQLHILISLGLIYYLSFPTYWIPSGVAFVGIVGNGVICSLAILFQKTVQEQQKRLEQEKKYSQKLEEEIQRIKTLLLAQERLAFLGKLSPAIRHEMLNNFELISQEVYLSQELIETQLSEQASSDMIHFLEDQIESLETILEINGLNSEILKKYIPPIFLDYLESDNAENLSDSINQDINLGDFLDDCWCRASYKFRFNEPENFKIRVIKSYQYQGTIKGNEDELRYIFINLLDNAYEALLLKFWLNEENYQPILRLEITKYPNYIQISIEDNGIGIEANQTKEIFKPFFTTKQRGSGLGLSLARDIVISRYQGTLELNLEGGTRFTVTLPC